MRRLTGIALLTLGGFSLGACSSADATADTTPAMPAPAASITPTQDTTVAATTPSTTTPLRPTAAVDPGMVLSGHEVVTSAEVGSATDAAANG